MTTKRYFLIFLLIAVIMTACSSGKTDKPSQPEYSKLAEWKGTAVDEDYDIEITSSNWYVYWVMGGDLTGVPVKDPFFLPHALIKGSGQNASKNVDFNIIVTDSNNQIVGQKHLNGNGADSIVFNQTGKFHIKIISTGKWALMVVAQK